MSEEMIDIKLDPNRLVVDIILDHTECGWVLMRHGIDYARNGRHPLGALCRQHGVDVATVCSDLEHAIRTGSGPLTPDPRTLATAELLSFLVERHHLYLRSTLPFVAKLAARMAEQYGERNGKLHELRDVVGDFAETFEPHLDHEEERVFPLLASGSPPREVVESLLAAMEEEHVAVAAQLSRIRAAADGYAVPTWASTEYATLMRELQVLELDTLRHVHLETHVLMPRFAP